MNNKFSNRFETARDRLSKALNDLETITLQKIAALKESKFNSEDSSLDEESQKTINNLHNQINILQENLSEIGLENENLFKENKSLAEKFSKAQITGNELVKTIKIDLQNIKNIINQN